MNSCSCTQHLVPPEAFGDNEPLEIYWMDHDPQCPVHGDDTPYWKAAIATAQKLGAKFGLLEEDKTPEICPVHNEPFIVPDDPDGFRRCTFYIPELGASEDYGCPQPLSDIKITERETSSAPQSRTDRNM